MPIFGSSSSIFDADVEKITNEKNTSEDWGLIMDLCDRISARTDGPREVLRAIYKRLNDRDPHVVLQAITLLDACVNNCGKPFRLEVASRDFEVQFKKILNKSQPKVKDRMKDVLKKWAEGEFKGDPQLNLIPSLYTSLKREGIDFSPANDQPRPRNVSSDPKALVSAQKEEEDLAKAIQLSLQETKKKDENHLVYVPGLYGNVSNALDKTNGGPKKEQKKARALYDFEAAEDNELTFKTGEMLVIIDDSDANWWKGSNHRGEGLFPANFVTTDLTKEPEEEPKRRRSVQFNESVEVNTLPATPEVRAEDVRIDEDKLDRVLVLLHDADPSAEDGAGDPPELAHFEAEVNAMAPKIDAELEVVDRRLAQLTRLSTELVDALNLYHQLMRGLPYSNPNPYYPPAGQQMMYSSYAPISMPPASTDAYWNNASGAIYSNAPMGGPPMANAPASGVPMANAPMGGAHMANAPMSNANAPMSNANAPMGNANGVHMMAHAQGGMMPPQQHMAQQNNMGNQQQNQNGYPFPQMQEAPVFTE